jgi:hypothetical protein
VVYILPSLFLALVCQCQIGIITHDNAWVSVCAKLSRPIHSIFVEASKLAGIKPDVMRIWLNRAEVRTLLLKERKAFRAAICAGNEQALQRVRDKSPNGMATVAAMLIDTQILTARAAPNAASAFVKFMAAAENRPIWKEGGFEPPTNLSSN